ncbi:MAG: SBBP repeat-containing protein [Acidobacteria bacterium]|nr:SBBP repeat-containing protein [Acidobacteriota bacterium]
MRMLYSTLCFMLAALPCGLFAQSRSKVDWSNFLSGGSGAAQAVAIDRDGGIWVAGSTAAQFDAPGPNDPFQKSPKGRTDVFVAKYQRDDSGQFSLKFFTWLGGTGNEEVRAMTLDSLGRVYLTGITDSTDFPTGGFFSQESNGGEIDAFVTVIDPKFSGIDSVVHSSYYGAAKTDIANAIAVDAAFNIYVAGYTTSENLPGTSGGAQGVGRGGWEAFLFKLDPSNTSPLRYATYFGGDSTDIGTGVAVDSRGIVWLTGHTSSSDFPVTANAHRSEHLSFFDGFLVGLDTNKAGLEGIVYASYFGGNGADFPRSLRAAADGTLWVAGYTFSTDLPVTATAVQSRLSGNADVFVMGLNVARPGAEAVIYATYLGGADTDIPYGFTLLEGGRLAVSGYTTSANFPTAGGALQSELHGTSADGFVAILNPAAGDSRGLEYATYLGGKANDVATGVTLDSANGLFVCGYTNSSDFPAAEGSEGPNPLFNSAFVVRIVR